MIATAPIPTTLHYTTHAHHLITRGSPLLLSMWCLPAARERMFRRVEGGVSARSVRCNTMAQTACRLHLVGHVRLPAVGLVSPCAQSRNRYSIPRSRIEVDPQRYCMRFFVAPFILHVHDEIEAMHSVLWHLKKNNPFSILCFLAMFCIL